MELELWGGPLDGELLVRSKRPAGFIWIDMLAQVFTAPADDRLLYRIDSSKRGVVRYRFAGNETARCEECGWFSPRSDGTCLLCNAVLQA